MGEKHLIVVSAENNPYLAWQSKLFHFSCVSRLEQSPVIVVHETRAAELCQDFQKIILVGGRILRAESFKVSANGEPYPARNTAGTLVCAAREFGASCDSLVLCDPDMIFVRASPFPETLSGDFCSYIDFDRDFVEAPRAALNIPRGWVDEQKESLRCGVPYVIPTSIAGTLGEAWLEAIDTFAPRRWEDVMYAFGLAAVKLRLPVELTHLAQNNFWPAASVERNIVHYCYGDAIWNKRDYYLPEQAPNVWRPVVEALGGTVLGEIVSQLREAEHWYCSHAT